ncbi:MAG: hypothetical protein R2759_11570 [Bacteroidales bacterium]
MLYQRIVLKRKKWIFLCLVECVDIKGIISLKNDRGTSYDMYIQVQNELAAAIRELRDEMTQDYFGMRFDQLTDEDKIKAIQKAIPVAISEAEPEDIGGK